MNKFKHNLKNHSHVWEPSGMHRCENCGLYEQMCTSGCHCYRCVNCSKFDGVKKGYVFQRIDYRMYTLNGIEIKGFDWFKWIRKTDK